MPDLTTHSVRVRTVSQREQAPATISAAAQRASDLGLGAVTLSTKAIGDLLDRYWPGEGPPNRANPSIARRLARAATGMALVTERRVFATGTAVEQGAQRALETARRVPLIRDVLVGIDASLDRWAGHADIETARREQAVSAFVIQLVPAIIDGVLERIDINSVLDRVDLDRLLDQVDIDRLLEHIDIDRMMSRIDLDALMQRIELGPIVSDVLDDVDIGGIVRESTGSITGDAVDSARLTAMRLDGFVGRVADRILLRGGTDRNPASNPAPNPNEAET
ncbi:MAG: hypothetical protein JJE46_06325 [Acidimicrobiia bacterium]|nr:hypothetical protein [Acidimicrobiia bacterium]